jgi:hypothetical protein
MAADDTDVDRIAPQKTPNGYDEGIPESTCDPVNFKREGY